MLLDPKFQISTFLELTFIILCFGFVPKGWRTRPFNLVLLFHAKMHIVTSHYSFTREYPLITLQLLPCDEEFFWPDWIYPMAPTLIKVKELIEYTIYIHAQSGLK